MSYDDATVAGSLVKLADKLHHLRGVKEASAAEEEAMAACRLESEVNDLKVGTHLERAKYKERAVGHSEVHTALAAARQPRHPLAHDFAGV